MRCADIRADIPNIAGPEIVSKYRRLKHGYPRPTVVSMADQGRSRSGEHKTNRALFTIDKDLWKDFGKLVENRAAVLRDFIAWYVGRPGTKLPRRPKPPQ